MFSLKDKVALVTGASQGIGRDTALALAKAGAKVAAAARNEEKLSALVAEITANGGEALAVKMDVADQEQVKSAFKTVLEKFGRLDILVNNAAITKDGLALRMKAEDWDAVIRTNLTGAHFCTQQALSTMMRARAGRIITVNAVAPGFIETPMTDVLSAEVKDELRKRIPLGRMGTPADVTAAIVFLASDEAAYITGHVLDVNGGMYLA